MDKIKIKLVLVPFNTMNSKYDFGLFLSPIRIRNLDDYGILRDLRETFFNIRRIGGE